MNFVWPLICIILILLNAYEFSLNIFSVGMASKLVALFNFGAALYMYYSLENYIITTFKKEEPE